jgi:hypothetical protein
MHPLVSDRSWLPRADQNPKILGFWDSGLAWDGYSGPQDARRNTMTKTATAEPIATATAKASRADPPRGKPVTSA